ncbi:uncharacterized protein PAC_02576 [Phialocephala subalpina]|uniref:Heterokaryon incompatibility domain-containing protein n=1 Tax=Phialocephala subalpina TaxID=576137 RepID=A0A1L7WIU6_9HELO|nr:uncharacterized protein PAC_02576 [Phialocephala subalpina]
MAHSKRKRDDLSPTPPIGILTSSSQSNRNYEHFPLATTTSIRILELQPGEGTTTLKCKLSTVERGNAAPYEAISYSWGRSSDTRVIYCESKKLKVTVNLRDALWRIRDPVEVKMLWADAVCINQNDNEERANQVKQMGSIYANAVRVLVWLDVPNAKFGDFDYLFDVDVDNRRHSDSRIGRASLVLEEYVSKLEAADLHTEGLDPDSNAVGHAFSHLLDSPWFTRLWVVQEVGLAKSVVAMFGDTTIDFVDLIRVILRLECRTLLIDRLGLVTAAKANIFTAFPARAIELAGEVEEDWDFLELMEVTRGQKASDRRDYIYALLGHPSAMIDGAPIVVPNYNMKADGLFFDIAVKLIRSTNSLRVLSAVQHIDESQVNEGAVSWIPTWTRDTAITSLGVPRDHYFDVTYDASAGTDPNWELSKSTKLLKVHGFVFDMIEECISTETQEEEDGARLPKTTDQLIVEASNMESVSTALEFLLNIGQTLTAGYSNDKPENFASAFAAFRLHLIKEAYNEGKFIPMDLAPEGRAKLRETAQGEDIDGIYWAASRFCTGRKLFSTQKGLLGLGPGILKAGDTCCILFGAPVPIVLRRVGHHYKLVGEAYVHGVMKGEAMVDFMLGQEQQVQIFDIK